LGIGGGDPLYVLELDAVNRRVIVGEKELLSTKTIKIKDVNWIGDKPFEEIQERKLKVRVRSTSTPVEALVTTEDAKSASVTLNKAEEGIAPGQACVFYERDGTRVLGGGWITKS
jgi:tRNA-specific 2-thiouridylase